MTYFPQGPAPSVSSALRRFTSVFGKGTGGTTSLISPGGLSKNLYCMYVVVKTDPNLKRSDFFNDLLSFKDANINSEAGQALDH